MRRHTRALPRGPTWERGERGPQLGANGHPVLNYRGQGGTPGCGGWRGVRSSWRGGSGRAREGTGRAWHSDGAQSRAPGAAWGVPVPPSLRGDEGQHGTVTHSVHRRAAGSQEMMDRPLRASAPDVPARGSFTIVRTPGHSAAEADGAQLKPELLVRLAEVRGRHVQQRQEAGPGGPQLQDGLRLALAELGGHAGDIRGASRTPSAQPGLPCPCTSPGSRRAGPRWWPPPSG